MEKGYHERERCGNNAIIRVLAAAFISIIALLVVLTIALLLTQKPVDLSLPTENSSLEEPTTNKPLQQFRRRKLNYQKFTFDQLFSGKLFLKDTYEYEWTNDGSLLRKKDEFFGLSSSVVKIESSSFDAQDYLDDSDFMKSISSDELYAYQYRVVRQIFRHSTERVYEIVKITNGTTSRTKWSVGPRGNGTLQAFYWNPNPESHDFVFVHNYNIFYQSDPENPATAVQLTSDGEYFYRYGVANWLYEEEILDDSGALWWSSSGRYVSYLRFDDRLVNRVFLPTYSSDDPYVQYFELPYPKAGVEHNSRVSQFIWDREKNKIVEAVAPDELRADNQSYYVLYNTWMTMPTELRELGTERLITVWSNREQNRIFYTLCNEIDCLLTYTQSFTMHGKNMWAEPKEVGSIFPTKTGFFTILPHSHPDNNVYNHVAHIELETSGTGKVTKWIGENYDVTKIMGYWQEKDILTYCALGTGVGENNLYRVPKATNQKLKESISALNSLLPDCEHGLYSVDPTGRRAVLLCHTPFQNTKFYLMNIDKPKNHKILDGDEDAHLPFDKLNVTYGVAKLESGIEVHYQLMTPPKMNRNDKYPLLVDLYGGPNSKKVAKSTPSPQMIQICSQYEIAVANVDVRGTAGRGWNLKHPVYKKLGQYESQDTLDFIKFLTNNFDFIDENNVAVMGWSYGGFLSTQIALQDQGEIVKCAVAIAPVTDFSYYDTAYTERYLGLPLENPSGYNSTNLIPRARSLRNVKYLLAHGERDDNVHYQNSARWSEALQLENIHFTQLVYANEAHNLYGKVEHLYSEVQNFLMEECFESPILKFTDEEE